MAIDINRFIQLKTSKKKKTSFKTGKLIFSIRKKGNEIQGVSLDKKETYIFGLSVGNFHGECHNGSRDLTGLLPKSI